MNLLCPNCQKMLTVPEQYAGQLMQCPLCSSKFTVPALPPATAAPAVKPAEPFATPMPAPDAGTAEQTLLGPGPSFGAPAPAAAPPAAGEVYGLAPAPPPLVPPPVPPKVEAPRAKDVAERPSKPAVTPPPPLPPVAGYGRTYSIWISPRVVAWIAPMALVLTVLLLFAPWVETYLSEKDAFSQSGWGTGFGSWWSTAGAFHILLLLVATALACLPAARAVRPVPLPPQVEKLWPFRWAIISGATLLIFLLLVVELLGGFGLENIVANSPTPPPKAEAQAAANSLEAGLRDEKKAEVARLTIHRTNWLRLAVLLQVVALVAVAFQYQLEQRGSRPLPRIDAMW